MFARHLGEPAFAAAGEVEISAVDAEHAALHQHAFIEPVAEFDGHAAGAFGALVDQLGPAVQPTEGRFAAVFGADIGLDRGGDEPVERLAEQFIGAAGGRAVDGAQRSEEHTSELQSLMRISYAVFCLKKKKTNRRQRYSKNLHSSKQNISELKCITSKKNTTDKH